MKDIVIKVIMKTGKEYTIRDVTGFKTFRDLANTINTAQNAVFNSVSIRVSEISSIEEVVE